MRSAMKTLFLNPPSFEGYDGGASSRWPATREIESYWYPVWLCYPAGMLPGSRVLDANPHKVGVEQTVQIARDYDFVVLYTSTAGFAKDVKLAEMMKAAKPDLKIAFVGPHVTVLPEPSLRVSDAIDFVCRKEFDHSVVEFAQGRPLDSIMGISYRKNGGFAHTPDRPPLHDLDSLPFVTDIYHRDLDVTRYNVPFLLWPYLSFYTSRGCPALCTFCLWPQTTSGHAWRTRSADNVAREVAHALQLFPKIKEIFFDDDTFNIRKTRVLEITEKFKPLKFTWSCTARCTTDYETLKAMRDAGCRLLIVGFESGDDQILKNIKKGATTEQARCFARWCKQLGILIHGDFIIGLPGETKETIERTMQFAEDLDCETIQVSIAHAYPGTAFHEYLVGNNYLLETAMTDEQGHQLPHLEYPGLSRQEIVAAVNRFYDRYYFRPRVAFRIVRKALFNSVERRRLYHEAVEFLRLRAQRWKFAQARPRQSGKSTDRVLGGQALRPS